MTAQEMLDMKKLNGNNTSHLLHIILSVLTAGIWLPIYFLVTFINQHNRQKFEAKMRKRAKLEGVQ